MVKELIDGKTIEKWIKAHPLLEKVISNEEVFWTNPKYGLLAQSEGKLPLGELDVKDAEERLTRFAPYIAKVFPQTKQSNGLIESPLAMLPNMQQQLEKISDSKIWGKLFLKCDNELPISGSIKARGGIYEVLKHAENLAIRGNMLSTGDDYAILDSINFRNFFSQYSIAVGSTGNLGLSIGIMGAKLGFHVTVHMSADAKQWKKDLLRSKGVYVIEYESDYSQAVEEGRKQSNENPNSYFIDDENSKDLFLGYAVAANRLKQQLDDQGIVIDENHPLFVYLPCGVGGAPGGVTFGLKLIFRDNVHCFFSEPTHSPAMLVGLITGLHDKVAVGDFGIDNITDADGLAVGRPSGFVGRNLENLISGVCTVKDEQLYGLLAILANSERVYLEPSALAGFPGVIKILKEASGRTYLENQNLNKVMGNAIHVVWATGGSMVPKVIMQAYYNKGLRLLGFRNTIE